MHIVRTAALAAAIAWSGVAWSGVTWAADISGAGSTFVYPVVARWAEAYAAKSGKTLDYKAVGSGSGITQIKAGAVTFGATDAPLPGRELAESRLAQFPIVMGGIVPIVNLESVKPGELVIDGPTLAKIFLGKIRMWDDPALAKLNPQARLPKQAIVVVHRSDGSGTTYNLTYYLSEVSPDWKANVGTDTAVQWPTGIGAKGNGGVADGVAATKGGLGYVEYAYAMQKKLGFTRMINKAGKIVSPTLETFEAAAASADWKSQPGYGVILANQSGANSWPIAASTWILMHKNAANAPATREALGFFAWVFADGQGMAKSLDYVPMPAAVVSDIEAMWSAEIRDPSGGPLFPPRN